MINVQSIRSEIVGDSSATVPYVFAVAVLNHARWPVEAYAIDATETGVVQTYYWVQGNLVGKLNASGSHDDPDISCSLYPVSEICKLDLSGKVGDTAGGDEEFRRCLSIYFRSSDQPAITVNVNDHNNRTLRGHADKFIEAVLKRLA